MVQILVLGGKSKLYHNINKLGHIFFDLLTGEGYSVTTTEDIDHLLPKTLKKFDVVVDYTTQQSITESHAQSVMTWVKSNSKLYMGIHGATTSYQDAKLVLEMIGARFIRHPPIRKINVSVEDVDHSFMKGISDFTIRDELYIQEYLSPFQILLSTKYKGKEIPLCWTKPFGKGTVFYLALGHGKDQLKHCSVQQIIKNVINGFFTEKFKKRNISKCES